MDKAAKGIRRKSRASKVLLLGNGFLFILKLVAGVLSNSIAVLSDAFNSLTDVLASIAVFISIRVGSRAADEDHPFGHHRAEPIAALIIAILAGILGFEVIRYAVVRLLGEPVSIKGGIALAAMAVTMITKSCMGAYFYIIGKKLKSPAFRASFIDAVNDVFISCVVITGILGAKAGVQELDSIVGLLVGIVVIISGYRVGKENIDYLMGKSADPEIIKEMTRRALSVEGVIAINDLFTQHIGSVVHVELHIEVDPATTTHHSHEIGKAVQRQLEAMEKVSRAFIHIDPHYKNKHP